MLAETKLYIFHWIPGLFLYPAAVSGIPNSVLQFLGVLLVDTKLFDVNVGYLISAYLFEEFDTKTVWCECMVPVPTWYLPTWWRSLKLKLFDVNVGYLISAYLVEEFDWSVDTAVNCFAQSRPPGL